MRALQQFLSNYDDKLSVPSYRGFLNRIEKLTPYEEKVGRQGKRKAGIEFDSIDSGVKTERVMERVSVDHTKLDLFVVDTETLMPLGRPWLTLALDEYSRSIVGAYISFRDPDFIVLVKLIRNIIEDKDYIKDKYPFILNEWACYGTPEVFICNYSALLHIPVKMNAFSGKREHLRFPKHCLS